jgi:sugar O-acyltransferase (sialic acid O-acetyltransferase NeuD family)
MTKPVYVLGAGGHGKVVCDVLLGMGRDVKGFLDSDQAKVGRTVLGIPVYDQEGVLSDLSPEDMELANGIGLAPVRRDRFERLKTEGYSFVTLVHPSVVLAQDVQLGEGVQIMAGSIIQPGVRIGDNTVVNTASSVDHDCILGAHCFLGPGVTLCGNVLIGEGAHVGTGATVIEDIKIGRYTVIGGGAVVTQSIESNVTAVGVPARVIKRRG